MNRRDLERLVDEEMARTPSHPIDDPQAFALLAGEAFYTNTRDPRIVWRERPLLISEVVNRDVVHGYDGESARMGREGWLDFFRAEDSPYLRRMQAQLEEDPDVFEPVVVLMLPDGSVDVGDGWHRIASAARAGLRSINAIVGEYR